MSADIDALMKDPLSATDDELNRLMADAHGEEAEQPEPKADGEDPKPSDEGAPKGEAAGEQTDTDTAGDPGEPTVDPKNATVLTRDGKHQIPYSVLETERDRAARAEQEAQAARQLADTERAQREVLERQLAELNEKAKAVTREAQGGKPDTTRDIAEIVSEEQLAAIREEAPELGAIFDSIVERIGSLQTENQRLEGIAQQSQEELQRDRAERARSAVEDAIGTNPKLVYTRSEKPEVFNEIVAIDDWVRAQPKFQRMSLPERFAKSVAMYEAAHGAIDVPGSARQDTPKPTDTAAKDSKPFVPNTLSDLPGGSLPPKSDAEAMAEMSAVDLQSKFMDMTPDQVDTVLARLSP